MDFTLTADQRALQARVQDFVREHCPPDLAPRLDTGASDARTLHRALGDAGLLGIALPPGHGGAGKGLTEVAIIAEALGQASGTAVNLFCVNGIFAGMLVAGQGTAEQRSTWLPGLATGDTMAAFALTEPTAGSDAAAIRTTARRDGDGFVLDGTKTFTTGAEQADVIVTVTRTNLEGHARHGTTIFLVPTSAPGLHVRALPKLAGNGYASCEVRYDGVRIGAADVLGGPACVDAGWGQLLSTADLERLCVAASSLGLAEAVYAAARDYAGKREAFGKPIGKFQAIQQLLVDTATEIAAMRWLVYHAAWLRDRGDFCLTEVCMAKLFCSERAVEIATRGMRVFGGYGYLQDFPAERLLRESFLALYAGGTSEIQRNTLARLLGL